MGDEELVHMQALQSGMKSKVTPAPVKNFEGDASDDPKFREAHAEFLKAARKNPPAPVRIELKDLSFKVVDKPFPPCRGKAKSKHIIKNVNAVFEPGKLVAIMGASGAGKTTLLNILAGFNNDNVSGEVLVNDQKRDLHAFRKISSYITQEDRLHPNLTPREAVNFATRLKVWDSQASTNAITKNVLNLMHLVDCADVHTGNPATDKGLSGGQRKRLALAQELVSTPSLIMMDEPTSGLDALTAYECIYIAKALSSVGTSVLCTIHQPSSRIFQLFDEVMVLGRGQVIYFGPVKDVIPYFDSLGYQCPEFYNPADFIIEVAAAANQKPEELERLITTFKERSSKYEKPKPLLPDIEYPRYQHGGRYPVPFYKQVGILTHRAILTTARDLLLVRVRLMAHIMLGIICGLVWLQIDDTQSGISDRLALICFSLIFLMLLSLMPTVLTFPNEKAIFDLEHKNNWYGVLSYFLARSLVDVPFQVVFPIVYGAIVYWMAGLNSAFERFVLFELMIVLYTLCTQSLGILISCAAKTPSLAVILAPVLSVPQLLFCGFFIAFKNLPVFLRWLQWLVYFRYAFEFLAINEFEDTTTDCSKEELVVIPFNKTLSLTACPITSGNQYLIQRDLDPEDFPRQTVDIIIIIALALLFRFLAYFVLRYKSKTFHI